MTWALQQPRHLAHLHHFACPMAGHALLSLVEARVMRHQ